MRNPRPYIEALITVSSLAPYGFTVPSSAERMECKTSGSSDRADIFVTGFVEEI